MKPVLLQAIQIKLAHSNLILGLLSGVSIACCLIIASFTIMLITKLAIIALILLSSAYFIARDALLLLPWSWQSVDVDVKGELIMTNKRGQQFQPALASNSFTHAACTILNFKRPEFKNGGFKMAIPPMILMATAQNADELRKLRIWLRWFKHSNNITQ